MRGKLMGATNNQIDFSMKVIISGRHVLFNGANLNTKNIKALIIHPKGGKAQK